MMRSKLDEQLATLKHDIIEMGALCEEAIACATQALGTANVQTAAKVAPLAAQIDHKEKDIESNCLKMLLQQQPVARDLRRISAALKMITDMERIGDQAEDIAEIISYLGGKPIPEAVRVRDMAQATIRMVTDSVNAYVGENVELAEAVIAYDDTVDRFFDETKRELIELIASDPENGEYALDLLMVCKYFERIGDHATNIAEWVIFSVTGVHKDGDNA